MRLIFELNVNFFGNKPTICNLRIIDCMRSQKSGDDVTNFTKYIQLLNSLPFFSMSSQIHFVAIESTSLLLDSLYFNNSFETET
jgi:hypothetical protein